MKKLMIPLCAAAIVLGACTEDTWEPGVLRDGPSDVDMSAPTPAVLEQGRLLYASYCSGCHGVNGDGVGPSAAFMDPKPRDFRVGTIKFAEVESGKRPRDEDYLRVITNGLADTAMPAFRLLPVNERMAIVAYIKTFAKESVQKKAPGAHLSIPRDPYQRKPDKGVRYGARVYHGLAACHSCHSAYATRAEIAEHMESFEIKLTGFRERLYQSEPKDSDWGAPITPPDFLYDAIKTGHDKEEIVRVVAAGVGGTAMPTWAATLNAKQLWGLAYYVEHIARMRNTPEGDALREKLLNQPPFEIPKPAPPPPPEPEPDGEGGGGGEGGQGGQGGAKTNDTDGSKDKP